MTEHERIVRHVAACAVCRWLSRYAIRTRDPVLLDAAIRLRETYAANEAERERFASRVRVTTVVGSARRNIPAED